MSAGILSSFSKPHLGHFIIDFSSITMLSLAASILDTISADLGGQKGTNQVSRSFFFFSNYSLVISPLA